MYPKYVDQSDLSKNLAHDYIVKMKFKICDEDLKRFAV